MQQRAKLIAQPSVKGKSEQQAYGFSVDILRALRRDETPRHVVVSCFCTYTQKGPQPAGPQTFPIRLFLYRLIISADAPISFSRSGTADNTKRRAELWVSLIQQTARWSLEPSHGRL
jgi:hypothetical protein